MKKTSEYNASIRVLGKNYTSNGKTIEECLSKLDVPNAKGIGILTVSNKKSSKERILSVTQTSRLFTTAGLSRQIALKQISSLFNGV